MMNYFTSTKSNSWIKNLVLLLSRVFIGFAMISHGYPKLEQLLSGKEIQFMNFLGLGPEISLGLTVFSEFVCSIFIILGLFTRWASFFLIFTMAVAAFVVHAPDAFDKREMSLLYFTVYLLIFAFGPGRFSIDAMIRNKKTNSY